MKIKNIASNISSFKEVANKKHEKDFMVAINNVKYNKGS